LLKISYLTMPSIPTRHPTTDGHIVEEPVGFDAFGALDTFSGDVKTLAGANKDALDKQFYHLVMGDPNAAALADTTKVQAYEPLQMDLLKLPKKNDVALGPAAACAMTCKEQAKLRETECDKLRARVIQALKDGHCPSKITGIRKMPCGGGTKKAPKKSAKSKK
jgi:hypothetical protein